VGVEAEQRQRVERLYGRHAPAVHAYARRRSDAGIADDVVMEVFVVACRRLHDVPEDALPWLPGCARRVMANQRRGAARAQALAEQIRSVAETASVDVSDAGVLADALEQLPERDQELLLLTAWEGLDLGQVAEVIGCSRGAAGVRLHRARKRLRQALDCPGSPSDARPGSEMA
jgi:RNA polymerase sigma-70 factor, ECF subfamily